MKRLRSIRWRLLFWYGLLLTLLLTSFGIVAFQQERTLLERDVNQQLEARVNVLVQSLESTGPSSPLAPPPPPPPKDHGPPLFPDRPLSPPVDVPSLPLHAPPPQAKALQLPPQNRALFKDGYYYVVWLRNGPPLTASANAPRNIPPPDEAGIRQRDGWREACVTPAPGDIVLAGVRMDHPPGLSHFGWMLTGGSAAILGIGLLGGWWLITLSLRPIRSITAAATRIAGGDLSRRIDVTETESELGELALVLNRTFERLEEAFARQERFTADAAHELRTPLTVILTHVQNGLAIAGNNEEQQEAFEACQRAARRMRNLVESLLHLSRVEGGEGIRRVPCNLALIAEEAVELVRPLARSRRATIHTELAPAPLVADPGEIHQVLVNLLGNAIHHGPDGVSVTIVTCAKQDFALCSIRDNGPGIPAEDLPRIFDRFFRVDKARTPQAGHAGLGLSICQAIISGHNGTIVAESILGNGATFTLRLPAAR